MCVAETQAIGDDEVLWRRVLPSDIKEDGSPNSGAFTTAELSVDRSGLTTLERIVEEYPQVFVFEFTALQARGLGLQVRPDPPPPSHALVLGAKGGKARRLRDLARCVRTPPS